MRHPTASPRRLPAALLAALAAAALASAGCYKHVVRASGPGSDRYQIYEPASENVLFGNLLGGDDEPMNKRAR